MKILVTGSKGFLGKNLIISLKNRNHQVLEFDLESSVQELPVLVSKADFIVHLAGVNRPLTKEEFYQGNSNLTYELIEVMKKVSSPAPLIFSSSTQALLDNDYGKSKKMGEDFLFDFQKACGNKTYIYRLTNLFGKWSRPNYNSVVATFCYNVSHNLPIQINDPSTQLSLLYVDDVVNEFIEVIEQKKKIDTSQTLCVSPAYSVSLGHLADLIFAFKESRQSLFLPKTGDLFEKKLYSTYLSFLDPEDFEYSLKMNIDNRGSFTEFFRTSDYGQVSVNITKPGITKGNHYHHLKTEKFLVVKGKAAFRFRKVDSCDVFTFSSDDVKLVAFDVPPGYTHNFTNVGETDLIIIIWASEPFDKDKPDTFPLAV